MTNTPVIIERTFDADIATLWQALTEKEFLKQWYFDLSDFKAEVGFEFQFEGCTAEEVKYRHLCEVTEIEEEKKLSYSWRYDGYEGISYVTFELFPKEEKTKLILTHSGLESFPQSNKDFAPSNFAEGWNTIINDALYNFLNK